MHRRIVGLILACIIRGCPAASAQDFKLLGREVEFYGFASQGFIYTDTNNWLTMNTSHGGAFTDFGLNASATITDRLRVGAQVYDR
jgi:hypothetical protein